MNVVVELLEGVSAEGREIFAGADDLPRIQAWMARREAAFAQVDRAGGHLTEAERTVVVDLIESIRRLDAAVVGKFQDLLNGLSAELAATRKLKVFLAARGAPERSPWLHRAV